MPKGKYTRLHSTEFQEALRGYAQTLLRILARDMERLSDSGFLLTRGRRITLRIQQCDPVIEAQRNWAAAEELKAASRFPITSRFPSSTPDDEFLDEWVKCKRGRLLIIAPCGAGKSVLLAELTCRLAEELLSEGDYTEGDLPSLVPVPIRLREWTEPNVQKFEDFFYDYCLTRSEFSFGSDFFTAADLKMLASSGRLLPLFDGFDELPPMARNKALVGIEVVSAAHSEKGLTPQFILTSRPGYAAENTFEERECFTLRDLTPDDIRTFVTHYHVERGCLGATQVVNGSDRSRTKSAALIAAYKIVPKHIDQLLRRPLFITAWCNTVNETPQSPPRSLSDLMMAIYKWTMLQRGLDAKYGDKFLVDSIPRLGVILGLLAEADFGWTATDSDTVLKALAGHSLFTDEITRDRTLQLAIDAGFVTKNRMTYSATNVPITQYLIGQHIASLCEPAKDELEGRKSKKQFVRVFQRWAWRHDFDDIWLYAFDVLWRGSPAAKNIASYIVDWVLNFGEKCAAVSNWQAPLSTGQIGSDREPFTCAGFVLRALLPVGNPNADNALATGVDRALEQIINVNIDRWRYLRCDTIKGATKLTGDRRAKVYLRTLELLGGNLLADARIHVIRALDFEIDQLTPDLANRALKVLSSCLDCGEKNRDLYWSVKLLIDRLASRVTPDAAIHCAELLAERWANRAYKDTWFSAACIIESLGRRLQARDANRLLTSLVERLLDTQCKEAWRWLILPIGSLKQRVDLDVLEATLDVLAKCLRRSEYKSVRSGLINAVVESSGAVDCAPRVRAAILLTQCLRNPDYVDAWPLIASGIGNLHHVRASESKAQAVEALMLCFRDPKYRHAWGSVAFAIGELGRGFNEDCRTRSVAILIRSLGDASYREAWPSITSALAGLERGVSLSDANSIVSVLVECLGKQEYRECWSRIAADLTAQRADVDTVGRSIHALVRYLRSPTWKESWSDIIEAINRFGRRADSSVVRQILEALIRSLEDALYKKDWKTLSNAINSLAIDEMLDARVRVCTLLNKRLHAGNDGDTWGIVVACIEIMGGLVETASADFCLRALTNNRAVADWQSETNTLKQLLSHASVAAVCSVIASIETALASPGGLSTEVGECAYALMESASHQLDVDHALQFADEWARAGRIGLAMSAIVRHHELTMCIGGFEQDGSGERVVYRVCRRNDEAVVFDRELQCAPIEIRELFTDVIYESAVRVDGTSESPQMNSTRISQAVTGTEGSKRRDLPHHAAWAKGIFENLARRRADIGVTISGWKQFKRIAEELPDLDDEDRVKLRNMDVGTFAKYCLEGKCKQWWSRKGTKRPWGSMTNQDGLRAAND